ncbi:MAG: crossover junction endodeoxyribonuclease RuvC [Ignavibacteriales bacterium]|nr:crossover junction endodeoxyribonuclease RuvC [Ignavibacteriales bacterium]
MRILGIDPGTQRTGFGIIELNGKALFPLTYGTVHLEKIECMPEKLECIFTKVDELIHLYQPDQFVIEMAFFGKNVQSALKIGLARGAAIVAAQRQKLIIGEYAPREIKKSVTGYGAASKEQVSGMVKTLLNLKISALGFDESDALAVAICHAFRHNSVEGKTKSWKSFIEQNPGRIIG